MKTKLLCVALASLAFRGVHAQSLPLHEYCAGNDVEKKVADATAYLVPKSALTLKLNGNYSIATTPFTSWSTTPTVAVCSDEPYYAQPHPTIGRTAFLVGPGLMVTAPHVSGFQIQNYAAIFGMHATETSPGVCTQPNYADIPAANVKMLANNAAVYEDVWASSDYTDYMLFQLPTNVTNITPLPLRRNGAPDVGDSLYAVGHSEWMSAKIDRNGSVHGYYQGGIDIGDMATLPGASGSPVFNPRTNLVETIVSSGSIHTKLTDLNGEGCHRITRSPINQAVLSNNGSITDFSSHVPLPPKQLSVNPQAVVRHVGPVGGPLSNATSQFTVAPPPSATGPLTFNVSLPLLLPPAPSMSISPPAGSYTLNPGDPALTFTVSAGLGAVTSCKRVDSGLGVIPTSPDGFISRVQHIYEVGMVDFTATPSDAWNASELGAPYSTRSIEVVNTRPHASAITVASNAAWVRVNGAASANLTLAAAGSPGDRATVTLGFDEYGAGMPAFGASGAATVTVAATQPACGLRSLAIPVTLARGIERFKTTNTVYDYLPLPAGGQTFGAVAEFPVNVTENAFTVDDVDLAVRFFESGGIFLPAASADTTLKIELVAPDGTSAVLWDRNDAPSSYFSLESIAYLGAQTGVTTLKLDSSTTPPLGPGSLTAFNGKSGPGLWKVRLSTTSTWQIHVAEVELRIAKKRQASLYTFNTVYDYLPAPGSGQTFGAPADFLVDLSAEAAFRVDDVDLNLGFYPASPFLDVPDLDTLLRVELTSPANTTSVLWDRNNATGGYLGTESVYWLGSTVGVSTLRLDTTTAPPLGGGTLSAFNGQSGAGVWRVRLVTTDPSHRILPSHVNLLIGR